MIKQLRLYINKCSECPYYRHHYCTQTGKSIEGEINESCPLDTVNKVCEKCRFNDNNYCKIFERLLDDYTERLCVLVKAGETDGI